MNKLFFTIIISILLFSCNGTITQPKTDPIELGFITTNVSVFGGSDGAIDLTVNGGNKPYQFEWSTGATTEDISNLKAGTYIVDVTDSDQKTITDSTRISEPPSNLLDYSQVTDNIVVFEEEVAGGVNITLLSGDNGNLLVDTGYDDKKSRLQETILSIKSDNIEYIINTHHHSDHIGGNSLLRDGGILIGSEEAADIYLNSNLNAQIISINNSYEFNYNGEKIECILMPPNGHSISDIIVRFTDSKVLCLGDLYLSESFPSVHPNEGGGVPSAISNLEYVINNFPSDSIIIPGHGQQTTMQELKDYLAMVKETVRIVRGEMAEGKNLSTIIDENVLAEFANWGTALDGLTTTTWIISIYYSYINEING